MSHFTECLGFIAPYYNLVLVVIVVALFIAFFRKPSKKFYIMPWKLLFTAISVYIIEAVLTVLNDLGMITINKLVAPILEMFMISLFIYMLLLQRDYLKKVK